MLAEVGAPLRDTHTFNLAPRPFKAAEDTTFWRCLIISGPLVLILPSAYIVDARAFLLSDIEASLSLDSREDEPDVLPDFIYI